MKRRQAGRTDVRLGARLRRDRGTATVWLLATGLAVVLVGAAFALVGSAVLARHRAENAADLGALAAAVRLFDGTDPCAAAASIVAANRARLVGCRLDGTDVVVTAAVATPFGLAQGVARAGTVS